LRLPAGFRLPTSAVSLIPDNASKLLDAVGQILRNKSRDPPPETLRARVADLTRRGRDIANQIVALYNSAHSGRDRELILEAATELRMILMQPGLEWREHSINFTGWSALPPGQHYSDRLRLTSRAR
jgi:hypothetical protein